MTDDRTPQELLADARAVLVEVRDRSVYLRHLRHRHEASALIDHIAALEAALGEALGLCRDVLPFCFEAGLPLSWTFNDARSLTDGLRAVERHRALLPEADD